jgi:thiamine-monophosphate kinase
MRAERELIAGIRARARRFGGGVRLGIGDDCAVLRPKAGHELVVTTDMLLEGRHFRREWHSPESVGHRCLARGLSDIAAMGARPVAAFLSVAVPGELAGDGRQAGWVERFLDGLLTLADEHRVTLAGGDTAESPGGVLADIVVMGEVPAGRALLRSGARAGDLIYVTGALGGAAAELARLERSARWKAETRKLARAEGAAHPHFFPQPRIGAGLALQRRGLATAMIDVSDGLSTDLDHLCEESGLRAEVDAAALPVHALAVEAERRGWTDSGLGLALHGGEDYELLFTARAGARVPKQVGGVAVRAIGRMLAAKARQPRMVLRHGDGRVEPLAARGWEHFRKS